MKLEKRKTADFKGGKTGTYKGANKKRLRVKRRRPILQGKTTLIGEEREQF